MNLEVFRQLMEPFITFFGTIILGGFSTSGVVQFLKAQQIPLPVQRYPRLSNAILSGLATIIAVYISPADLVLQFWWEWLVFGLGIFATSAWFYNNVFRGLRNPGE